MSLVAHEYANLFPMMGEVELSKLAESIRENGLRDPIIVFENQILDGRNRYRACEQIGVVPSTKIFDGDDPLRFVVDHNLHRRHLTESQRAMVASSLAKIINGGDRKTEDFRVQKCTVNKSVEEAASDLSVGKRNVFFAKKIRKEGSEGLVKAVEDGQITVGTATGILALPKEDQEAVLQRGPEGVKLEAKRIRTEADEAKKAEVVTVESTPQEKPININRMKVDQQIGIGVALTAINTLKRINKNDSERVEALQKVIDHCADRLAKNI